MNNYQVDELDRQILEELALDARITIKEIAKRLERRRATIHTRIGKLLDEKIIKGFTIVPDYTRLDRPITAFILSSVIQQSYDQMDSFETLGEKISSIPDVTEVHSTTGEFDYLIKVRVKNVEDIGRNIVFKLRKEFGMGRTLTLSIFHTSKEELDIKNNL